jgi:hypothetical protein
MMTSCKTLHVKNKIVIHITMYNILTLHCTKYKAFCNHLF